MTRAYQYQPKILDYLGIVKSHQSNIAIVYKKIRVQFFFCFWVK